MMDRLDVGKIDEEMNTSNDNPFNEDVQLETSSDVINNNDSNDHPPHDSLMNDSLSENFRIHTESSSESEFADDEKTPTATTEHQSSAFDIQDIDKDARSTRRQRHFSVAGKKAGLLRLFESQFFTPHMAICYLHRYNSDPGVQYYLCQRLRDSKYHADVEFLLPQLCHLMVMNSKEECGPLECFVIEFAASSLHSGSVVLWYLEGYLQDIQEDIILRARCIKLLQLAQRAVFGDEMPHLNSTSHESFIDDLPDLGATLVGFGCILASFAAPQYVQPFKPLLLMEARKADALHMPLRMIEHDSEDFQIKATSERRRRCTRRYSDTSTHRVPLQTSGHSLKRFLGHALESVPGFRAQTTPSTDSTPPLTTTLFYQPEMQFVASLVDIARRLCNIPKEQRLSSLHAELSLIDYELPAQICIPLWCPHESCHDRIVRIDVQEAVILNSAERVPFVVFIEVIRGGMIGFDEIKTIDKGKERSKSTSSKSTSSHSIQQIPLEDMSEEQEDSPSEEMLAEKMHMAAVMLAQLAHQSIQPGADIASINAIKVRIISEMEILERQRILGTLQSRSVSASCESLRILETSPPGIQRTIDDPSAAVLRENWQRKLGRIKSTSPYGHLNGWTLLPIIVKAGSDMRQEQLAGQLVREFQSIWKESSLDIWVKYYRVLVASADGGLVETVTDAVSIHSIKKAAINRKWSGIGTYPPVEALWSLRDHYIRQFGSPDSQQFLKARDAFVASLAGYSLFTYILAIKDRHNGNILIDKHGHLIHIDFGFMLSNSPGSVSFESSPFKLPAEYIELLGGLEGVAMNQFKRLFHAGFVALRKHSDRIITLVETMWCGKSELPCLYAGQATIDALKARFQLGLASVDGYVDTLIASSANNVFTRLYDSFQYYANGVY